jgi:hypothetical protein
MQKHKKIKIQSTKSISHNLMFSWKKKIIRSWGVYKNALRNGPSDEETRYNFFLKEENVRIRQKQQG